MGSRKAIILVALMSLVCAVWSFQNTPDYKVLFEKAKFAMETKGDLQGAIKLFQEIIAKYPQEKEYAARAQLYIGLCFEKLGNSEAIKAYELVLKKYADRPEEVAIARERLAVLRQQAISGISVVNLSLGDSHLDPVALSPDGTKMLAADYESGDNIACYDFVANRKVPFTHFDNSDKSYFAEDPIWSPDGKQIAYEQGLIRRTHEGLELRVSTLDGKSRVLCTNEEGWITPCDWLRDGSAIVTILWNKDDTKTLGLAPLSGEPFKALFSIPADWDTDHAFVSPDGRFITLEGGPVGAQNIYVISVDDQSSWVLADHPADEKDPRWSPDGKHIVFLSLRHGGWALWGLLVKDGRPVGQPFMIKEGMPNAHLLNWTANGLAFSNFIDVKDIFIQEVNPETNELIGQPKILSYRTTGGNVSPSWSPDGKYLAFASSLSLSDLPSRGHIIVMPADGGLAREFLVSLAHPSSPILYPNIRWLPDSSGLGYTIKDEKGQEALVQLEIATGESKTFAIPTKMWTDIEWSGNGKSYYYAKHLYHEEPDPGIIEHNLETGNERYVYRPEKGKGYVFRSFRCSRDYRWLVIEQIDYVQNKLKEVCQIFALELKSGKVQTVTSALEGAVPNDWMRFALPAWSPDRNCLLVLCNHDKSSLAKELGIIPAERGSIKKLPMTLNWPAGEGFRSGLWTSDWSPDGKKIAFTVRSVKDEAFLIKNVIAEKR
jgi:Tol biopolymer transport system component